jgi:hypothetical protein
MNMWAVAVVIVLAIIAFLYLQNREKFDNWSTSDSVRATGITAKQYSTPFFNQEL